MRCNGSDNTNKAMVLYFHCRPLKKNMNRNSYFFKKKTLALKRLLKSS